MLALRGRGRALRPAMVRRFGRGRRPFSNRLVDGRREPHGPCRYHRGPPCPGGLARARSEGSAPSCLRSRSVDRIGLAGGAHDVPSCDTVHPGMRQVLACNGQAGRGNANERADRTGMFDTAGIGCAPAAASSCFWREVQVPKYAGERLDARRGSSALAGWFALEPPDTIGCRRSRRGCRGTLHTRIRLPGRMAPAAAATALRTRRKRDRRGVFAP